MRPQDLERLYGFDSSPLRRPDASTLSRMEMGVCWMSAPVRIRRGRTGENEVLAKAVIRLGKLGRVREDRPIPGCEVLSRFTGGQANGCWRSVDRGVAMVGGAPMPARWHDAARGYWFAC